jgi:hypothetical protein
MPPGFEDFISQTQPGKAESVTADVVSTPLRDEQYLNEACRDAARASAVRVLDIFKITKSSWASQANVREGVIYALYAEKKQRLRKWQLQQIAQALNLTVVQFLALGQFEEFTGRRRDLYWKRIRKNIGEWKLRTYEMGKRRPWH